jgi:N-acetylglucosaminyldiphosphoundecaprenol N-acetyl-beta-D-mannosaminyltransferase
MKQTEPTQAYPVLKSIPTSKVLGIRFHCLRIDDVIHLINDYIVQKVPRQICLVNAYTMSLANKDKAFGEVLNLSDLVLADGMSIKWGGGWVGATIPERVAGPDLMKALCAEAALKGHRIFLLGNTNDTLNALAEKLNAEFPGISIVGMHSPSFCAKLSADETKNILTIVKSTSPDILLVSMSGPKQEKWISENIRDLNIPVCIGVGAAFDFLSGKIPRAPLWLQKSGLEWAHRLSCEPRRLWKRYLLGNIVFLSALAWQVLLRSFSPRARASH